MDRATVEFGLWADAPERGILDRTGGSEERPRAYGRVFSRRARGEDSSSSGTASPDSVVPRGPLRASFPFTSGDDIAPAGFAVNAGSSRPVT